VNRREFLNTSLAASMTVATAGQASAAAKRGGEFRKGICSINFDSHKPLADCFAEAKAAGFEGMEIALGEQIGLEASADDCVRVRESADKLGLTIISVWVSGVISKTPLNDSDPKVRQQGVDAILKGIRIASALGSGAILLVPGEVGWGKTLKHGYQETWDRFSMELPKVISAAEYEKVCLTLEEVWNRFLVSPLEMRAFVDQFHSEYFKAHFDVGNVLQYGFPEDWIRTLGPRVQRVHMKDYKLSDHFEQGKFVDLLQGSVDWPAVMSAFRATGFHGFLTPEYGPDGDPEQLRKIAAAWDRIVAM
jgi:L-ribulose-5-phosphate 3-epimerase